MDSQVLSGDGHKGKSFGENEVANGSAERRDWRPMVKLHYSRVQLFFPEPGGYSEVGSRSVHVRTGGEWQTVEIPLPADVSTHGRIRLDPGDARGIIDIAEIQVVHPDSREPLWRAGNWADSQFSVLGTAVRLRREEYFSILSYGGDPILLLPVVESIPSGSTLRVRMRALIGEPVFLGFIRAVMEECLAISPSTVVRELMSVALASPQEAARMLDDLQEERDDLRAKLIEIPSLREQLRDVGRELAQTLESLDASRGKLTEMESAAYQFREEAQDHARRTVALECELQTSRAETAQIRGDLARLKMERDEARAVQKSVIESWSWRLTAPLRYAGAPFLRR